MILTVIVIYLVGMLLIGVWASKQIKDDQDYLIGGFRMGILPMTGTYLATFFSALSLLGGVGLIYRTGIGGSWMPMAWALGSAFGPIIAVRFRRVKMVSHRNFSTIGMVREGCRLSALWPALFIYCLIWWCRLRPWGLFGIWLRVVALRKV